MSDERKYSVVGRVEIGTDEYRDLIEEKAEAEREKDNYQSKYWKEQEETKRYKTQVEKLEKELCIYKKFIASTNDLTMQYRNYLIDHSDKEVDII